jgi:23S rRNA G2445 N2-methylase RlmL
MMKGMNANDKTTLLITCAKGLNEMLRAEVEELGFKVDSCHETGVELTGDMADAMRLNLHLRTAFNVLYLLGQFECRNPDQLYREVSKLPWEDIIPRMNTSVLWVGLIRPRLTTRCIQISRSKTPLWIVF